MDAQTANKKFSSACHLLYWSHGPNRTGTPYLWIFWPYLWSEFKKITDSWSMISVKAYGQIFVNMTYSPINSLLRKIRYKSNLTTEKNCLFLQKDMRSKINGQKRCRPHFGERARKKEILMWKVFTCSSKHLFYEISSLRLNKKHIEGTFHTILQNIWCFIALIDTLSAFLF